METEQGGCNDKVIVLNNFSFATTNGIELTFTRNHVANDMIPGWRHDRRGHQLRVDHLEINRFATLVRRILRADHISDMSRTP